MTESVRNILMADEDFAASVAVAHARAADFEFLRTAWGGSDDHRLRILYGDVSAALYGLATDAAQRITRLPEAEFEAGELTGAVAELLEARDAHLHATRGVVSSNCPLP